MRANRPREGQLHQLQRFLSGNRSRDQRANLEADLDGAEKAIRRLTAAIVAGGELSPLVSALDTYERQRRDLEARLAAIKTPRPKADPAALRRTLEGYLTDWQGLLRAQVGQAQQVLRRLVVGRLTFTPDADGAYTFAGRGTVKPVLAGAVRMLASPTGFEPFSKPGSTPN